MAKCNYKYQIGTQYRCCQRNEHTDIFHEFVAVTEAEYGAEAPAPAPTPAPKGK